MENLERYEREADPPAETTLRETVRFLFDEIQRRAYQSTKGLTLEQVNFQPDQGGWSIGEILGHQLRLVAFITNTLKPGSITPPAQAELGEPGNWDLEKILRIREEEAERFRQVWAELDESILSGLRPDLPPQAWAGWTIHQRFLRPLTDLATHVGQINYIRRQLGNPVGRY